MKTDGNDLIETLIHDGVQFGLTKREYFAAMAMQGIWSNPHPIPLMKDSDAESVSERVAAIAVKQADALIEELNKEVK